MTRDSQQYDIYDAERASTPGRRFETVEEMQVWVNAVLQQDWWGEVHPHCKAVEVLPVTYRKSKGMKPKASARLDHRGVGMLMVARGEGQDELTLVHELAHIGATARFNTEGHDPTFAREFLELTYRIRGIEEWERLKASFIQHGIVWDQT